MSGLAATSRQQSPHRTRQGAAVLLGLAFLLGQLLFAAHETHHLGEETGHDYCELCLIAGGAAQAGPADAGFLAPAIARISTSPPATSRVPVLCMPGYSARAPPVFPILVLNI